MKSSPLHFGSGKRKHIPKDRTVSVNLRVASSYNKLYICAECMRRYLYVNTQCTACAVVLPPFAAVNAEVLTATVANRVILNVFPLTLNARVRAPINRILKVFYYRSLSLLKERRFLALWKGAVFFCFLRRLSELITHVTKMDGDGRGVGTHYYPTPVHPSMFGKFPWTRQRFLRFYSPNMDSEPCPTGPLVFISEFRFQNREFSSCIQKSLSALSTRTVSLFQVFKM